jgi:hypothetical protein
MRMKRFTFALVAAFCCLMGHAAISSVDDLVGIYSVKATGTEKITNYTKATDMSAKVYDVEITKNEDGTITIYNLLNFGSLLIGTVNLDEKTITVAPGYVSWATFASITDSAGTASVVADFTDNGKISFYNFAGWYYETNYISEGAEVVLTKTSITKEWTVEGGIALSDSTGTAYHSGRTTLTKYNGSDDYDYALKLDYAYASPLNIQFKVSDEGYITIANGSQTPGYSGAYFYYIYENNYYAWLDTTTGYATFSGTKDGGEMYIYCYDYDNNASLAHQGYLSFLWGTLDGIATAKTAKADNANAPIYDLSGRRVVNPTAGVYIQNGKKFVVKK